MGSCKDIHVKYHQEIEEKNSGLMIFMMIIVIIIVITITKITIIKIVKTINNMIKITRYTANKLK